MKRLKYIFVFLIFNFILYSCSKDSKEITAEITPVELELNMTSSPYEYVDIFVNDLYSMYGIDYSSINDKPITIVLASQKDSIWKLSDSVYGRAYGYNNDDIVFIIINKDKWNISSIGSRHYLMYHELGHDILNLPHSNDSNSIMYSTLSINYDTSIFLERKQSVFLEYINLLNKKHENTEANCSIQ